MPRIDKACKAIASQAGRFADTRYSSRVRPDPSSAFCMSAGGLLHLYRHIFQVGACMLSVIQAESRLHVMHCNKTWVWLPTGTLWRLKHLLTPSECLHDGELTLAHNVRPALHAGSKFAPQLVHIAACLAQSSSSPDLQPALPVRQCGHSTSAGRSLHSIQCPWLQCPATVDVMPLGWRLPFNLGMHALTTHMHGFRRQALYTRTAAPA